MTAEQLRARRVDLALSQFRLAVALGVTPQAVSHWECGRRPVPPLLDRALRDLERELEDSGRYRIAWYGKDLKSEGSTGTTCAITPGRLGSGRGGQ